MSEFTVQMYAIVTADASHPADLTDAERKHLGLPTESESK